MKLLTNIVTYSVHLNIAGAGNSLINNRSNTCNDAVATPFTNFDHYISITIY
jgi:hypothetical protein